MWVFYDELRAIGECDSSDHSVGWLTEYGVIDCGGCGATGNGFLEYTSKFITSFVYLCDFNNLCCAWPYQNVAGRTLVGLRYWNQVDEDGESYWVFESRDVSTLHRHPYQQILIVQLHQPSHPANPVDSRMFWVSLRLPILLTIFISCLPRSDYALCTDRSRSTASLSCGSPFSSSPSSN